MTTTVLSVKRVAQFLDALVRAAGRSIDLRRTFSCRELRAVSRLLNSSMKASNLACCCSRLALGRAVSFLLQRQMHPLVPTVLLGIDQAECVRC